jgi:hypothetical protein
MTLKNRIASLEAKMPRPAKASGYGLRLAELPEARRDIVIGMLTASDGTAAGAVSWARYYALMEEDGEGTALHGESC